MRARLIPSTLRFVRRFAPHPDDYALRHWRSDLLAGLTVAVVALPLALGFGVASGAGATAGLVTAIVAGTLAAIFGGSNFQVSGPTGAMTAVLLPIVASYGPGILPFVGLLAGGFLLAFAAAGFGRVIHYIPWPVVSGFTNGIAVIIALQQIPFLLGSASVDVHGGVVTAAWEVVRAFASAPTWTSPAIAAIAIAVMIGFGAVPRLRAFPAGIVALVVASAIAALPAFADVPRIGLLPTSLPIPAWPLIPTGIDPTLLVRAALAIAVLAALESLLSAVVADGMTVGERHDADRELFGQGIANLGAAVFGGVPATAALARTAVNVRSGARTRLAAASHGVILFAIVALAAPLAAAVPLAALGGILVVVAARMVEAHAVRTILRSTKSDAFVLLLTFVVTVAFDLILALEVGLIAAGVTFVVRMSRLFRVDPEALAGASEAGRPLAADVEAERDLGRAHVVAYRVDGPIFFGAANRFFDQLLKIGGDPRVVVLRLRRVPVIDATGAAALESLIERLAGRGIVVLLSGLQPQPQALLERMGTLERLERSGGGAHATSEEAIAAATELTARR
jgi:sulfate permease, SulP family